MQLDQFKSQSRDQVVGYGINLAEIIRNDIIAVCKKNGGHLGASLGAVELALGIHYVFTSPQDKIIWDVGHQAYAHKWLTKRIQPFSSLRMLGGVSGFLKREESEHDHFGAGHSSTSLSAALGIAQADSTHWTLAVIGDGGLTAGLAFEALNQIAVLKPKRFVIVLNDNAMSISKNVGAISKILAGDRAKDFFEHFGLKYISNPKTQDGNDLESVIAALENIKSQDFDGPVLVHFKTQKGKGLEAAEAQQEKYHGIGPSTQGAVATAKPPTYSQVFGSTLCQLAAVNPKIVAITAAMSDGTGLTEFSKKFPRQFYDVGIAEQHAVTFAAGLATQGYLPVVAIYSTFLQRALDQVIHDVCLQKLDVIFAIDRAGLVGQDGPTHHGVFDLGFLQLIPGIKIFTPATTQDLEHILKSEINTGCGPIAIRYPRGSSSQEVQVKVIDGFRCFTDQNNESAMVAVGPLQTILTPQEIEGELKKHVSFFGLVRVKPLSDQLLKKLETYQKVIVIEEAAEIGGVGTELLAKLGAKVKVRIHRGIPDRFIEQGTQSELMSSVGLDAKGIRDLLK